MGALAKGWTALGVVAIAVILAGAEAAVSLNRAPRRHGGTDDGAISRDGYCGRINDDYRPPAHGGAVAVCPAHSD